MKNFKEPLPKTEYLFNVGDIILSGGKTFIYQITQGPVCKLYRETEDATTYESWKNESSWYDTGCPVKGWRRNGPNFPSYWVNVIDPDTLESYPTSITVRWITTKLTLEDAIKQVKNKGLDYQNSSRSVEEIQIDQDRINKMKGSTISESNVDFIQFTCI